MSESPHVELHRIFGLCRNAQAEIHAILSAVFLGDWALMLPAPVYQNSKLTCRPFLGFQWLSCWNRIWFIYSKNVCFSRCFDFAGVGLYFQQSAFRWRRTRPKIQNIWHLRVYLGVILPTLVLGMTRVILAIEVHLLSFLGSFDSQNFHLLQFVLSWILGNWNF